MKRWRIADHLGEADAAEVTSSILGGGILILPTDTIYGLHASAFNQKAIDRIAAIKSRSAPKPLAVLVSGIDQLITLGTLENSEIADFLERTWPAPLTAILPLRASIPASAGTATIAVRAPALDWLLRLLTTTGPLVSTSVNIAGEQPLRDLASLSSDLERNLDGAVDAGPLEGKPSTLVDFTLDPPEVIRQGVFRFSQKLWKRSRKSL